MSIYLFAVFCEGFFERNRLQPPLVVCPDAILHLLSPQGINCFVRLVEARKKLINDERSVGWRKTHRSVNDFLSFWSHQFDYNKQLRCVTLLSTSGRPKDHRAARAAERRPGRAG